MHILFCLYRKNCLFYGKPRIKSGILTDLAKCDFWGHIKGPSLRRVCKIILWNNFGIIRNPIGYQHAKFQACELILSKVMGNIDFGFHFFGPPCMYGVYGMCVWCNVCMCGVYDVCGMCAWCGVVCVCVYCVCMVWCGVCVCVYGVLYGASLWHPGIDTLSIPVFWHPKNTKITFSSPYQYQKY